MTLKNKNQPTFFTVVILTFLFACGQFDSKKNIGQVADSKVSDQVLTIDTFSFATLPKEIDGCACYLSNDSIEFNKDVFIYVNDWAETSFMKINGVMTRFTQTEFKEVNESKIIAKAKSNDYELIIELQILRQIGGETSLRTGVVNLKDKKGHVVTKTLYGESGC